MSSITSNCEPAPELAFFPPPFSLDTHVTPKPMTGDPPSKRGGEIDTTICPALAMIPAILGAFGGPALVAETDMPDAGPTLKAFFAAAWHV